MARKPRISTGGVIYHVINRANAKKKIFESENDYLFFKKIFLKTVKDFSMPVLGYCIMPNHWHLLLHPQTDGELPLFMKRLTETHAQGYHRIHGTTGTGHIYQDRYKSFLVEDESYLSTLYRYIESNPLRSGLVSKCEEWRWSSLRERIGREKGTKILCKSPIELPRDYLFSINAVKGV